MKRAIFIGITLFISISCVRASPADTILITSPDRQIQCRLFQQNSQLHFAVTYNNIPVVENSAIVMMLNDLPVLEKLQIATELRYQLNEHYPWFGAHATAMNLCSGIKILLQRQKVVDTLEVRVFNDGVAFRTILPAADSTIHIPDEATIFNIPAGSLLWYHDLTMHYEGVHEKKEISQVQAGEWVAPPATYKLPKGVYASITEANLVNYPGMALQANGSNGLQIRLAHRQRASYPYRLRYTPEDTLRLQQPAAIAGTIITPWRVVIIGSTLNTLVNSDIVNNLCPPPDKTLFPEGIYTSWVQPGRAVWKYLDGGGNGSVDALKKFTDDAATLGFEYNILEGFWARWGGDTLRQLIDYSRQKKVGIWLWKHSKTLRNTSDRQAFFKKCHDLGVTGLKIDFFDHEAKETIDLYSAILREAAENHLLLDFHGANKPTGLARTWPNLLTSEAVKGMEASKLTDRATHETTIPFTRCLAGPAEYTVLLFSERRQNTTWAHQIASTAILNSSLLTYAANPGNIESNPAVVVIKDIPAVWDETIVLPESAIGELAAYVRRKGSKWFVAVMNGATPKKLTIPLGFLQSGKYNVNEVKDDGNNAASVVVEHKSYTKKNFIELELVAGGGYLAEFSSN
ncbi:MULTISPECIES: glycoside hydrolase family 97 protein [Niastella]|uniref:Glycoside hydrolase family 97 catalytic domain-containing protein n=1 Tax=Niastella soli TaxID=2821487 RepID=A0ABS3YNM8_9BACT|nr:glycoside hydrolase family 97 protein [Niastella soli]MBO9198866.1 glycoside hydrolase family 97 catalytic domain-containing protein [Niastella soli]